MIKTLMAILLVSAAATSPAQTTYNRVGSTTYMSNHATGTSTFNRAGETTYMRSNGGASATTNAIGDSSYTRFRDGSTSTDQRVGTLQAPPARPAACAT